MANRYATTSGNWSAVATWDGGAAIPANGDDVYSNNYTIQLDQNIIANTLRSTAAAGINAGGGFAYSTAATRTIKCSAGGFYGASAAAGLLQITSTAGYTVTIEGNINATSGTTFKIAGDGTINWIGSALEAGLGAAYNSGAIICTHTGTFNITGNLETGTYFSATTPFNCWALYNTSTGTVNITGNVNGTDHGYSVVNTSTGPINITGNVTSGTAALGHGVYSVSAGYIKVIGIIDTATPPATVTPAISLTTGTLYVSGTIKNRSSIMAVSVQKLVLLSAASTTWQMINESAAQKNIYTADVSASGNPGTTAVRNGTVYGPVGELTGTLKVPDPSDILKDVPTDATVGTLLMTPTDFWGIDKTTLTVAGSIGQYLGSAATIDTTGDQLVNI